MDGKLLCKVIQRIKRMAGIETLLILAVTALDLAVVPWRIWANEFVPNAQFGSRLFKQRR